MAIKYDMAQITASPATTSPLPVNQQQHVAAAPVVAALATAGIV